MLRERIDDDLKTALKNRETVRISTLRFLKSALHNAEIDKQEKLKDEDTVAIIRKQVKERKDSIEEFKKGNRQDLVDKETKELEVLRDYLPEELKPEELLNIIKEAIAETKAASVKDMGGVMKQVLSRTKDRADGKTVSELVKKELTKDGEPAGEKSCGADSAQAAQDK